MNHNEFMNFIYRWLCDKLNHTYGDYMEKNLLYSKQELELPAPTEDVCKNLTNVIQLNRIQNAEILRINFSTPLMSLRVKHLFNQETGDSYINIIDIALNKIQIRNGGIGSEILRILSELQKLQLMELYDASTITTILAFKFLSIPFWMKNDFYFRCAQEIEQTQRNYNITYKLSKLLILMNQEQDLHQYIDKIALRDLDPYTINQILKSWTIAYYNKIFNENYWIKHRMIDQIGNDCIDDCVVNENGFCSTIIYKNICSQIAQDNLTERGILSILQDLFYLQKVIHQSK